MRIDQLAVDVRYALRQVRRNPAFSVIAIATLALGIGGITAVFSAFDAVLIRALPYVDAHRLVIIWDDMSKSEGDPTFFSTPAEWTEWRRLNTVFTDLACSEPGDAILDPYLGSGTTLSVAARLGRVGTGIDANPRALHIARQRLAAMGVTCGEATVNRPAQARTPARSSRKLRVA